MRLGVLAATLIIVGACGGDQPPRDPSGLTEDSGKTDQAAFNLQCDGQWHSHEVTAKPRHSMLLANIGKGVDDLEVRMAIGDFDFRLKTAEGERIIDRFDGPLSDPTEPFSEHRDGGVRIIWTENVGQEFKLFKPRYTVDEGTQGIQMLGRSGRAYELQLTNYLREEATASVEVRCQPNAGPRLQMIPFPNTAPFNQRIILSAVHAIGEDEAVVAGYNLNDGGGHDTRYVFHYKNGVWRDLAYDGKRDVEGLYASAGDDIYLLDASGNASHYDGLSWRFLEFYSDDEDWRSSRTRFVKAPDSDALYVVVAQGVFQLVPTKEPVFYHGLAGFSGTVRDFWVGTGGEMIVIAEGGVAKYKRAGGDTWQDITIEAKSFKSGESNDPAANLISIASANGQRYVADENGVLYNVAADGDSVKFTPYVKFDDVTQYRPPRLFGGPGQMLLSVGFMSFSEFSGDAWTFAREDSAFLTEYYDYDDTRMSIAHRVGTVHDLHIRAANSIWYVGISRELPCLMRYQ